MACHIKVYLFNDTFNYIKTHNILDKISNDSGVKLNYVEKKSNSYIMIEGKYEVCHKTRIILQDIEKEIYKLASNNICE